MEPRRAPRRPQTGAGSTTRGLLGRVAPLLAACAAALSGCAGAVPCSYPYARSALELPSLSADQAYVPYALSWSGWHGGSPALGILRLRRWELDPVRVFVVPAPAPEPEAVQTAGETVRMGIRAWEGLLGDGLPRFEFVDAPERARVVVSWHEFPSRNDPNFDAGGRVGEAASFFERPPVLRDRVAWDQVRRIWIDTRLLAPGSGRLLRRVAAHEIGHVLGLLGHSPEPADVMYALLNADQSGVTARDALTARVLYACPRFSRWRGERPLRALWPGAGSLRAHFDRIRLAPKHRAFAAALEEEGGWVAGWASGKPSADEARATALDRCEARREEQSVESPCELVLVDDALVDRSAE